MAEQNREKVNSQKLETISNIINEELFKARNESIEIRRDIKKQKEISDIIVEAIIDENLKNDFALKSSKALIKLIDRFELNYQFARITFDLFKQKLNELLPDFEEGTEIHKALLRGIENVEGRAIGYFYSKIFKEYEDLDIVETLISIKRELGDYEDSEEDYYKKALIKVEKALEKEIALIKDESTYKKLLGIEENKTEESINSNNEELCKKFCRHKEITRDRATLFLDYFFNYANIKCFKTERAKVISYLTGYSETKIEQSFSRIEKEKLESKEKKELSGKFYDDVEVIRKYFKILRLEEIQKQIDEDLEYRIE
ncbi:MAG: hypothetical protein WA584_20960 [Pyrinomonadaceae bacterium]